MLVIKQFLCLIHEEILWVSKPVSITPKLVDRVSHLPCDERDPRQITDRSNYVAMIERLKKKYKLTKGQRAYIIDSISNKEVHVTTQFLARKVMRKCCGTEVLVVVIALAKECAAGVRFNWSQFLCEDFLTNFREVREEGKTFHYAWLLLSIMLVAIDLPEESQFPILDLEWPKAT